MNLPQIKHATRYAAYSARSRWQARKGAVVVEDYGVRPAITATPRTKEPANR